MKMLGFVITLGVLYWAVTSYAQVRLSAVEPCANGGGAGAAEYQLAELASDNVICTQ